MDKAAFARWLGGLALLDAAQRLRVVADLTGGGAAMAASDGAQLRGISGDAGGGAAVVAATQVSRAGPAADLMSQLRAERLARFAARIATPRTSSNGAAPPASRAIAASPAAGPSIR